MQPIGLKTVKIIPSLFSGAVIDDFRFGSDNTFKVHYTGTHGWQTLEGSGTIFHDAQQAGWRTAAVGWYNPYCTTYRSALDSCYWTNLDRTDGDMAQRYTLWRNTGETVSKSGHTAHLAGACRPSELQFRRSPEIADRH